MNVHCRPGKEARKAAYLFLLYRRANFSIRPQTGSQTCGKKHGLHQSVCIHLCLSENSYLSLADSIIFAIDCHVFKRLSVNLMASQKVANCCVAANCLVTAAYRCTPHSSKFARLAFDDFRSLTSIAYLLSHHIK